MADVALQREARRRKITENAEARMNRLLGLTKISEHDQTTESASQSELDESPSQNSNSHSQQNEEQPTSLHLQPTSLHLQSHSSTVSTSLTSRNISAPFTLPAPPDRSSNRPSDYFISGQHSAATSSIPGNVGNTDAAHQTPLLQSEPEAGRTDKLSKVTQGLSTQTFEIMKISTFIIVAFLQRCILKFGLGLCIVPSMFVPFIVLEITFEYVVYSYLQDVVLFQSKGSLMSAAFMLCGMKQELSDTYNNIMAHVTLWLSDFCLYVFAFIVWNALIV